MPTRAIGSCVQAVLAAAILSVCVSGAAAAGTLPLRVLTYNTDRGGKLDGTTGQLNTIAAQNPDVVVLQEANDSELSTYVNGLNSRLGTTAWHGVYSRHCQTGTEPTCTSWASESVMVLTRLKTVATTARLIWAADDYHVARGAVEMTVALSDGTQVNVFGCHLPALADAEASRVKYVGILQTWAASYASPRLVGGDFNDVSGTSSNLAMSQKFTDGWKVVGSGAGYTHSSNGTSLTSRIDYWWSDIGGGETISSAHTAGSLADSDHISETTNYDIPSKPTSTSTTTTVTTTATTETTLLSDDFAAVNASNWPASLFTGTADATIPLGIDGAFHIGALKASTTGVHYNGVSSAAFNLSGNGYASVQLVTPPNTATTAYAMFAVGYDSSNFYRWYESGNALVAERKVAGVKTTLVNLPYDATADQFLRIRRAYDSSTGTTDVVFETAPNNNGVPGSYTVRHREASNATVVPSALRFELKAGTSEAVTAPGTVTWDNFRAASTK